MCSVCGLEEKGYIHSRVGLVRPEAANTDLVCATPLSLTHRAPSRPNLHIDYLP